MFKMFFPMQGTIIYASHWFQWGGGCEHKSLPLEPTGLSERSMAHPLAIKTAHTCLRRGICSGINWSPDCQILNVFPWTKCSQRTPANLRCFMSAVWKQTCSTSKQVEWRIVSLPVWKAVGRKLTESRHPVAPDWCLLHVSSPHTFHWGMPEDLLPFYGGEGTQIPVRTRSWSKY